MPRINIDDTNKYESEGIYLKLVDDGDYETVTILADKVEDIPIYAVHRIEVGGRFLKVSCLREADEGIEVCPLCASGKHPASISVELILHTALGVKVFERGKKFISKLQHWAKRHPLLCKPVFEISRIGKAGDMQTTYEFEVVDDNGKIRSWKELADEEEVQKVLERAVREWSEGDMEQFLATGKDPQGGNDKTKNKNRGGHQEFKIRGSQSRRPARQDDDDYEDDDEDTPPPMPRKKRRDDGDEDNGGF